MALNIWLVAIVVVGTLICVWAVIKWVGTRISNWLDSCIPQIRKFSWLNSVEAEIRLTDGKTIRGAGGNWTCSDGTQITDMALRIALRKRYEEEVDCVIKSSKGDEC